MPAFSINLGVGSPIDFFEAMEGSQDCAISSKQQVYKTIWKVRWQDAELAKVALLGRTTAKAAQAGLPAHFSRLLPHAHPQVPWLFCTEITRTEGREPRGKDQAGVAKYVWAFLYCLYTKMGAAILADNNPAVKDLNFDVPDESRLARFVRKRRKPAVQFASFQRGSWFWLDGGSDPLDARTARVPMEIPMRIPKVRIGYTWMGVPIANLNEPYINDTIGTCNASAFGGFPARSLLLESAEWPDYLPIPGRDGFQVDVLFNVVYYGNAYGVQSGPNFFPDPNRGNRLFEIGFTTVGPPTSTRYPIPAREWKPMFAPINT